MTAENLYHYKAFIYNVYDGDGVYKANVHMGIGLYADKHLRLYGVDCPELRGLQKKAGIIVRDYVRSLILNKDVIIKTHKDQLGKYGRLMVDIHINDTDLAGHLIMLGYGKPYFGAKKVPWTRDELLHIINNPRIHND